MRFLSLFSGIEAASVAAEPLGWECAAVAEVDPYCCALLKHYYPDVPNLGDVTKVTEQQISDLGHLDIVVFGSPCQDMSVAGKREGLDGARSGLFFDAIRIIRWSRVRFALWENVPGAFSSNKGLDFAAVVREMVGAECDVPEGGWKNSGFALGPEGLLEWACLDAQFFGVPQRRRRIFALRDIGNWANRPPILLERESLCGNPPPRRKTREETAGSAGSSPESGCRPPVSDGFAERERERERVICADVCPTLNTTWADRSAGSTAQEWDSEKGGRFVLIKSSTPSSPVGGELSGQETVEGKTR